MSFAKYEKDGKMYAIPSLDVTEVYNEGKAAGKAEAEANAGVFECTVSIGSEAVSSITVAVPFEPSSVLVRCNDKAAVRSQITDTWFPLHEAVFDLKTDDKICGAILCASSTDNCNAQPLSTSTNATRVKYENGELWIGNLLLAAKTDSGENIKALFAANSEYTVFCIK